MFLLELISWADVGGVVRKIFFLLDSIGLTFIDEAYDLMIQAISAFDGTEIAKLADDISKNCYIIIGIFALFRIALILVNTIINPDKLTDKEQGFGKVVTRLVITMVLFVGVPFIFDASRKVQNQIVENNYISKLLIGVDLLGESSGDPGLIMQDAAVRSLIYPNENFYDKSTGEPKSDNCSGDCVTAVNDWENDVSYKVINMHIGENYKVGDEDVYVYDYTPFITLLVGGFITYVLFSFAIDIAMRSVELAVLEILSPIFIVTYIDPKSSSNGPFKKWLSACGKTYLNLFVKIAVICLMLLFISKLSDIFKVASGSSGFLQLIVYLAILMFAKKAPKWLGDMFGIEGSSLGGLGIGKKFKEGLPMGDKIVDKTSKLGRAGAGMAIGAARGFARANKDRIKKNKQELEKKGIGYSAKARSARHNLMKNELSKQGLDPNKKYADMSRAEKAKYKQAENEFLQNNTKRDAKAAIRQERKDAGQTWKDTAFKGVAAAVGGATAGAQAGFKADKLSGALTGSLKAANQFADSKGMAKHSLLSDRIRDSKAGRAVAGIPGALDDALGNKAQIAKDLEDKAKMKKALEFTNHQATGAGVGEGKVPVSTGQFLKLFGDYKNQIKDVNDIGLATYAAYAGYESFRRDGDNVIFTKSDGTQQTISSSEFANGKVSNLINPNSSFSAEAKKAYATFQEQSLNNYVQNSNELARETATYREATQQRSNVEREIQQIQSGSKSIASNIQALCPPGISVTLDATSIDSMKNAFGDTTMQAMKDYKKLQSDLNKELLVDVNGMSDDQKKEHYDKITKLQKDLNDVSENIKIGDTKIEKVDEIISLVDQFMTIKPEEEAKLNTKNAELAELNSQINASGKYINDLRNANNELQVIVDSIKGKDKDGKYTIELHTIAEKSQEVAQAKSDADKEVAVYEAKKKEN